MANALGPVAASLDTVPERKARLQKAFSDLKSQRATLSSCTSEWNELEEHFSSIERVVRKRLQELAEKEKTLEAKAQEMQEALRKREETISSREEASLSRVQEQKDLAIAAILEEKRKWQEEKKRLKSEIPDVSTEDTKAVGDESAAKIDIKPSSNGSLKEADILSTPTKPACVIDDPIIKQDGAPVLKSLNSDVKARPQLKSFCENMDGVGLRKYIETHRKDIAAFHSEVPVALQFAIDPARLVLDALEGYPIQEAVKGQADKKESVIAPATRRACILLLETLAVVLADPVLGVDRPVVPSNLKEKAKAVADNWMSKMNILGDSPAENLLDVQAFLQLIATFGLATHYNEDDLCKLITFVARRRQSPALCRALGLASKIPDVVDRLSNEGKQLEALAFAHSFGIMDRIQPVPMLKTFLKEARKSAQTILKSGNGSPAAQNESGMKELSALKAVLKCIEEYKLESQYPSAPLQRRVEQLEKAKSDRKRAAVAVKAQAKRPKASIGNFSAHTNPTVPDRATYRPSDRTQYGGPGLTYTLTSQSSYDGRGQAGYSAAYAGASRASLPLSSSHLYSVDGLSSSIYGSALFPNSSTTYNSYQFGSGLPPPPPAYQASFLH